MKLAIIGSRDCPPIDIMAHLKALPDSIISGGARGADTYARIFAHEHNIPITELLPDYRIYGKGAPLIRDRAIVEQCDAVLAFWNGHSRGTAYTIDYARRLNKPIKIVMVEF